MNDCEVSPIMASVFPEVFKSVEKALRKYTPPEFLRKQKRCFLAEQALYETERLVGLPAKDNLGMELTWKLERTKQHVLMMVSFSDTDSTLDDFERMEANDEYIDVAVEHSVKRLLSTLGLPHRKQ